MNEAKISIAVIAQNEADRIGTLLVGCAFAAEVVVVDSGSTDGTQEICRRAGAKVLFHPWAGYVAQKQFALEATQGDWVLCLDADESVSESLAGELLAAVAQAGPEVVAFSMPRLSRYLGRWIRHGGWFPDRKVRLVRRGKAVWQGENPHDKLVPDGQTAALVQPLHHFVYRSLFDQVVTINNFSDIYVRQRSPAGGWFVWAGLVHALGKFAECYLWKLGLLDGLAGLIIAVNSAWYVFLRHAKTWEAGLPKE